MIQKHNYFKTKDNMVGVETKVWGDGRISVTVECRRPNGNMYRQQWNPPRIVSAGLADYEKLSVITGLISHMRMVAGKEL